MNGAVGVSGSSGNFKKWKQSLHACGCGKHSGKCGSITNGLFFCNGEHGSHHLKCDSDHRSLERNFPAK